MAKKTSSLTETAPKKTNLFSFIKKIDNSVEILEDSVISKISDWISTGSYIINACISGSIFGGIPSGRVTMLQGESGCGKSFLAASTCREGQYKGYKVVYLDTEACITKQWMDRIGVSTVGDDCIVKQINTVNEATSFILNLCDAVIKARNEGEDVGKIIIVFDSLGNAASQKEIDDIAALDAEKGSNVPADFTRTKDLKKMFRVITVPLAKANIPLIAVNHIYSKIGSYTGGNESGGGSGPKYAATVTLQMSGSKLEDKANDKAAAQSNNAGDIKRTGIKITCFPVKSRLSIARTVRSQIPTFKKPNPYVGLESYLNWDNAGIMVGKCYTEQEYLKLKPNEQTECIPFEYTDKNTGEISMRYAQPKKTMVRGVGIVCKHLGRAVDPTTEFWTPTVFTDEFLHYIDDNIIKPAFELPSRDSFDDINEMVKELGGSDDEDDKTTKSQSDVISTDIKK